MIRTFVENLHIAESPDFWTLQTKNAVTGPILEMEPNFFKRKFHSVDFEMGWLFGPIFIHLGLIFEVKIS